jgi:hypothetical protein
MVIEKEICLIDLSTLYGSQEPKASLIVLGHTINTKISKELKANSIIPIYLNKLKSFQIKKAFLNNKETFEFIGIDKNTEFIIKPKYLVHKPQTNILTKLLIQNSSLIILAGNSPNPVLQNSLVQTNEIIHLYTFNMYQHLSHLRIKQLRNSKLLNSPFDKLVKNIKIDQSKKVLLINGLDEIYDDCFEYDHIQRDRVIMDFVKQLEMVKASILVTCRDYKMFKNKLERFFVRFVHGGDYGEEIDGRDGGNENKLDANEQKGQDHEDGNENKLDANEQKGQDHEGGNENKLDANEQKGQDHEDGNENKLDANEQKGQDHEGGNENKLDANEQKGQDHEDGNENKLDANEQKGQDHEYKEALPKGSAFSSHESHLQDYMGSEGRQSRSRDTGFSRGRGRERNRSAGSTNSIDGDGLESSESDRLRSANIESDRSESETSNRPKGSALSTEISSKVRKLSNKNIIPTQLEYVILPQFIELQEINEIIKTCFALDLDITLDQDFIHSIAKVLLFN